MNEPTPDTPSGDIAAMRPFWIKVATILDGADAMRKAKGGRSAFSMTATNPYLPRFENETEADYLDRVSKAKLTNIFADVVENLAARPFAKEIGLKDTVPNEIEAFAEDVDAQGNHLQVFAARSFFHAIAAGIDWILVEHTKAPQVGQRPPTIRDERAAGSRPYWLHIRAEDVIAVHSEMIAGKEQFVHFRFREDVVEPSGFGEVIRERVRCIKRERIDDTGTWGPPTFEVHEKRMTSPAAKAEWVVVESGVYSIPEIPLVPVVLGRRKGTSWRMTPPMEQAAELQIVLFQDETALRMTKEMAAFPMLVGNGVSPPMNGKQEIEPLRVGPKAALFAPPNGEGQHGSWSFIEPAGTTLTFLAADIETTKRELRELGRQPLTAQTGNLTVITTAFAAAKGNAAIQAWALLMADALERALDFTAAWMGLSAEVEVAISTDFDLSPHNDAGPTALIEMRKAGDLSRRTLWEEMQRRAILSPDFDADKEDDRLDEEVPADDEDDGLAAVTASPTRPVAPPAAEPAETTE